MLPKVMSRGERLTDAVMSQREAEAQAKRLKNEALRQVLIGTMTPEAAEELALHWGLGPLSRAADPSTAPDDCLLGLESWTLAMGVAWLSWRTAEAVRQCYPPFAATRRGWVRVPNTKDKRELLKRIGLDPHTPPGFVLEDGAPASLSGMIRRERMGLPPLFELPPPRIPVETSMALVLEALADHSGNGLVAYADHVASGQTEALPAAAWETLAIVPRRLPPGIAVVWSNDPDDDYRDNDWLYTDDALIRHSPGVSLAGLTPVYTSPRTRRLDLIRLLDQTVAEPARPLTLPQLMQPSADDISVGPEFDGFQERRKPRARGAVSRAIEQWFVDTYGGIYWPEELSYWEVAEAVMASKHGAGLEIDDEQVRNYRRQAKKT